MAKLDALYNSFFKAEDFANTAGTVFTITDVDIAEFQEDNGKTKRTAVLKFEEDPRGLRLNKTRFESMVELFGSSDSDDWLGGKIKVIHDPKVMYGGTRRGGMAITAP